LCLFREEEAIKLDGLSVAQMKELRDKAEKHTFQAEVDRMMKLIINSLYRNKEVRLNIWHVVKFSVKICDI
jgi:heat shock protein beta